MTVNSKLLATISTAGLLAFGLYTSDVGAQESMVKKTLDGRCLAASHPEYWDTKVYIAKPSMSACVASGGKAEDPQED